MSAYDTFADAAATNALKVVLEGSERAHGWRTAASARASWLEPPEPLASRVPKAGLGGQPVRERRLKGHPAAAGSSRWPSTIAAARSMELRSTAKDPDARRCRYRREPPRRRRAPAFDRGRRAAGASHRGRALERGRQPDRRHRATNWASRRRSLGTPRVSPPAQNLGTALVAIPAVALGILVGIAMPTHIAKRRPSVALVTVGSRRWIRGAACTPGNAPRAN